MKERMRCKPAVYTRDFSRHYGDSLVVEPGITTVPHSRGTVELAKAQLVGGWELVSFKVTDLGDEVSVLRRPLAA